MIDDRNGAEYWVKDDKIIERVPPAARTMKRIRTVGTLIPNGYLLKIRRASPKHWHKAKMGWGFNEFVLRRCREFGFAIIYLETAHHPTVGNVAGYIPVTTLLKRIEWDAAVTSQAGFEPQVYIQTSDVQATLDGAKRLVKSFWTKGVKAEALIPKAPAPDPQLSLGLAQEHE